MGKYDYLFNDEFMTDEEAEEMLNSLLDSLTEMIQEDENKVSLVVPKRLQQFAAAYNIMNHLTKVSGAKLTYEQHKPFVSVGVITIIGKNLQIRRPDLFVKAARLASNINIYPRTDGAVQIDFTFHGLTKSIE